MTEFIQFLAETYAPEIIRLLATICFGCIGFVAAWAYKRVGDNKIVVALADVVVKFVEQAYIALDGPAKLEKALDTLSAMLKKKHINITRDDMVVFIEAAVAEMNFQIKKPLTDEATADATRRIDQNTAANELSDTAYNNGVNCGTM